MPAYSTLNRFSIIQLHSENRKQRAHLKKITEMQRRSGIDNGAPLRFPHLHQNFVKHLNEKRDEIDKENEVKSRKLLGIMSSKTIQPSPPFHPTNQTPRSQTFNLIHNNTEYVERIAHARGKYDSRQWKKQFDEHKEHLRLRKDNRVFTPLDIGVNRERIFKTNSLMNSKRTTPLSSSYTFNYKSDSNAQF